MYYARVGCFGSCVIMIHSYWTLNKSYLLKINFEVLQMCRNDIIAQIYYARRLAERLQPVARMIDLHGGHLVSHERTEEVFLYLYDRF